MGKHRLTDPGHRKLSWIESDTIGFYRQIGSDAIAPACQPAFLVAFDGGVGDASREDLIRRVDKSI